MIMQAFLEISVLSGLFVFHAQNKFRKHYCPHGGRVDLPELAAAVFEQLDG
jgi:hypothetical protein